MFNAVSNGVPLFTAISPCIILITSIFKKDVLMSKIYTQEEFDAAILASKNKFNEPESIEGKLKSIECKMDFHFRWTVGLLIGLYPIIFVYILFIFK